MSTSISWNRGELLADAFWTDADPEIPILKQGKSEYAKLQ